jgi:glycosyltransferase involved in cell wall biosynthesis
MKRLEDVRFSVVVPFYDEQENIPPLYMKLTEVMDPAGEPYELVFVDDGSRDQTFRILEQIQQHDARVHVIRLRRNFGQTAALKAGFDFARGDIIVSLDGDLQYDPAEIPRLLAKMQEGYDIVSGWRIQRSDSWLTRRLPSRVANWMMARLSGIKLHDFGATFKAYRREVIEDLPLYGELHRFIPAIASLRGATIAEVPVHVYPRSSGESKYGLARTVHVLLDLFTIKFLLEFLTEPLLLFGGMGLLFFCAGGLVSLFLLYRKLLLGISLTAVHGPLMLLAFVLLLGGIQFFSLGLLGEMLSRTYFESQKKTIYAVRSVLSRRLTDRGEQTPDRDSQPS